MDWKRRQSLWARQISSMISMQMLEKKNGKAMQKGVAKEKEGVAVFVVHRLTTDVGGCSKNTNII